MFRFTNISKLTKIQHTIDPIPFMLFEGYSHLFISLRKTNMPVTQTWHPMKCKSLKSKSISIENAFAYNFITKELGIYCKKKE